MIILPFSLLRKMFSENVTLMELCTLPHGSLAWNPELTALWTEVAGRCGEPDPFSCTPAWQLAFHDAFEPARHLLIHADTENVLAFAELFLTSGHIILTPLETHWVSGCPMLGPHSDEILEQVLPALSRIYGGRPPCLLIGGMGVDSPLAKRLFRRFSGRFRFLEQPVSLQRSASLDGGLDGYLSRRSANFRSKMKKAHRRAEAQGVMFERAVPSTPDEADRTYARMLSVEEKSWKGRDHCGMAESPSKEFYHVMIRRLSLYRGGRVIFATHDGSDIGFIFGGVADKYYRGQQFSYDMTWRDFSIGDLLQLEQLSWLCEEQVIRYDMGMSDDPAMAYKTHWAEMEQIQRTWLLIPQS